MAKSSIGKIVRCIKSSPISRKNKSDKELFLEKRGNKHGKV